MNKLNVIVLKEKLSLKKLSMNKINQSENRKIQLFAKKFKKITACLFHIV
ncbi:hypothetical protein X781_12790 [Mannheimia sp. USDA-ARS-USMARC-1261]|nr:hypothetical protein X781_12790 [Mannheimia sp. USDA-ARS-USMARC-1261]